MPLVWPMGDHYSSADGLRNISVVCVYYRIVVCHSSHITTEMVAAIFAAFQLMDIECSPLVMVEL